MIQLSDASEHLEELARQLVETQAANLELTGVVGYFRERCEKLERKLEGLHGGGGAEHRADKGGDGPLLSSAGAEEEAAQDKEVH